ncbi:MAG: hypothetical protein U9Q15_02995 [Patescibacteria group bacterium]|nr:hypothetical protein [Patescibacteria group bacterium]
MLKSPVTIFDLQPLKGKVQESLRKDIWNRLYDYAQYYPQYYIVGKKSIEYIDS